MSGEDRRDDARNDDPHTDGPHTDDARNDDHDTGRDDERSPDSTEETPTMHTDGTSETENDGAGDGPADRNDGDEPADGPDDGGAPDLVRYARYALLAGLTLLALVATLRFYFAVSNTIDIWVAREYRSLFQAAFNLVVLLLAAIGISWEVRKVAG